MNIRNVTDRARVIAATSQTVGPGETVEVDDDLGAALLEQPDRWGKATGAGRLEDRSKDELYARATELDIEGRSEMSKADLIAAIRNEES